VFNSIAKCLNYISAYIPLYLILILRFWIIETADNQPPSFALISLLILISVGVLWLIILFYWKNNIRISGKVEERNIIQESGLFSLFNVLPIMSIVNQFTLIVGVLFFIALGIFTIRSGNYFFNPFLYIAGYKQYKFDDKRVFSKKTKEELRLFLLENQSGLPSRELVENTYINFQQ